MTNQKELNTPQESRQQPVPLPGLLDWTILIIVVVTFSAIPLLAIAMKDKPENDRRSLSSTVSKVAAVQADEWQQNGAYLGDTSDIELKVP